jgi:hypothetical protein
LSLAPELRNSIYEEYPASHLATKTIRINAYGLTVLPPIISASTQLRGDTINYFQTWFRSAIADSCGKIEAQMRDVNHKPLVKPTVCVEPTILGTERKASARTTVTFIGTMDVERLMNWVSEHIEGPTSLAVFKQTESQPAQLSSFAAPSLMHAPPA